MMNNYERIKAMSIEKMTDFLSLHFSCEYCVGGSDYCNYSISKCEKSLKQWLESEVEDE